MNSSTKKPTLVLLPGLSFDDRVFQSLQALCESQFTVQAINYETITDKNLTLDDWFASFCEKMPASAHYVGWSVGGLLAWKLAQQDSSKVLSVASFASSPKFLQEPNWPGVSLENWTPFMEQDPKKMQRRLLRLQGDRSLGNLQLQAPFKSWSYGLTALKEWDMRAWVQETKLPLLLALAEQDALLPSQLLQQALGKRAITLSDCGHACIYTHPKACFSVLKEFWHA